MPSLNQSLLPTVDGLLETLPPVWDRIRSNLRAAGTEKFGITLEQFHALRHIRRGFTSVGAISDKRQVSRSAVSQAVEALVRKGLVTRTQESADRRCVRLALTPYASEAMDANYQANRLWMKAKMSSLSSEELECVRASMDILRATFMPDES